MKDEVARPGALAGAVRRGVIGREAPARRIETQALQHIVAQAGDEGEAVRRVDLDRMGVLADRQ